MNIPHQKPIKFAHEIIEVNEDIAKVRCKFDKKPTLAMLFEAAAQSSAAFSIEDEPKIGFLVSVKDVRLLSESKYLDYIIELKKELQFGSFCEFSFNVFDKENSLNIARGSITVMIQE